MTQIFRHDPTLGRRQAIPNQYGFLAPQVAFPIAEEDDQAFRVAAAGVSLENKNRHRRTEGRWETPLSSWKNIQAFRRRAFFLPLAISPNPVPDSFGIAFPRLSSWPLESPIHRPEDFPHITGMIANARQSFDDVGEARQGPEVCLVSMSGRPWRRARSIRRRWARSSFGLRPAQPADCKALTPPRCHFSYHWLVTILCEAQ